MIDLQFEKELLLLNAEEDNMGIYELILHQLSFHKKMKLAKKYDMAVQILLELTKERNIIIQKYESNVLSKKIKEYSSNYIGNLEEVLNMPQSWYIDSRQYYAYIIAEKGIKYLDSIDENRMNVLKLNTRFSILNTKTSILKPQY